MTHKCLIIGLGQIGMGYDLNLNTEKATYTHSRAISIHPAFRLEGAVDSSKIKCELFNKHYGRPTYPNSITALQNQKVSVIVISTPTAQHNLILKEVLSCSTPNVILCEKPLAYDLDEAREMVEMCESAGVKLFVNYMRRADSGAIEIKNRIESSLISLPIKGVVWYSKGFLNNGSHFFNLLEFWLGSFISSKILDKGRTCDSQDIEPDIQVEFERGKVVFIAAWEEAFNHCTIELLSPSGRLYYSQSGESIKWQSTNAHPNIDGYQVLTETSETLENGMHHYQLQVLDQLANALDNKTHTLSTGRDSLATLEAILQITNQR